MKIWKGKLKRKVKGNKEGAEVEAKIAIGDSGGVIFEASGDGGRSWYALEPNKVHPESWLRALAETGQEVP